MAASLVAGAACAADFNTLLDRVVALNPSDAIAAIAICSRRFITRR